MSYMFDEIKRSFDKLTLVGFFAVFENWMKMYSGHFN